MPTHMIPTLLRSAACAALAVAVSASPASAHRGASLLMPMDTHLLEADFIGRVEVKSLSSAESESPAWDVVLEVTEPWISRWPSTTDTLEFRMRAGAVPLIEGQQYVVLMSGGPHRESPFTHRDNSVFPIDASGGITCMSGVQLFGVTSAGFACSAQPLVMTPPITVSQMHAQIERARARAEDRQPDRARALDSAGRPLIADLDAAAEVSR